MSFEHAKARQPEIIRAVQKDVYYTTELAEDLSDILKLAGPTRWIRYNHLCKLIAEIVYHGFASINNLQTLGEEYTGIIQIDSRYVSLPSKLIQLVAIILEFGGDALYLKILQKLEAEIMESREVRPEAKNSLKSLIAFMKSAVPYIKAMHKTYFYLRSGKYQISKRITGINYILVRHWLQSNHSLYGYKVLGILTFLQLTISLIFNIREAIFETHKPKGVSTETASTSKIIKTRTRKSSATDAPTCNLCLEPRQHTSVTPCGHLFCWECIMEWLDERDECPMCREHVKKSNVVQLMNYS